MRKLDSDLASRLDQAKLQESSPSVCAETSWSFIDSVMCEQYCVLSFGNMPMSIFKRRGFLLLKIDIDSSPPPIRAQVLQEGLSTRPWKAHSEGRDDNHKQFKQGLLKIKP